MKAQEMARQYINKILKDIDTNSSNIPIDYLEVLFDDVIRQAKKEERKRIKKGSFS